MSATAQNTQPVQLWNGIQFVYTDEDEAKRLVRAGTHERAHGKDAGKLKGPDAFQAAAMVAAELSKAPTKPATKKPPRRAKGEYNTTQMKAK